VTLRLDNCNEYKLTPEAQGITGYPVTVFNDEERFCQDKEEFLDVLREMFASQTTVQIISTLMQDSASV
jgi:hypothetical protein